MTSRGVQILSKVFYDNNFSYSSVPDPTPEFIIPVHLGMTALVLCEVWVESVDFEATQTTVFTNNSKVLPIDTSFIILHGSFQKSIFKAFSTFHRICNSNGSEKPRIYIPTWLSNLSLSHLVISHQIPLFAFSFSFRLLHKYISF